MRTVKNDLAQAEAMEKVRVHIRKVEQQKLELEDAEETTIYLLDALLNVDLGLLLKPVAGDAPQREEQQ
jgi:hypothetical protein